MGNGHERGSGSGEASTAGGFFFSFFACEELVGGPRANGNTWAGNGCGAEPPRGGEEVGKKGVFRGSEVALVENGCCGPWRKFA